ncbi:hypothetical protein Tco_1238476 [Tanacetum coccineum]
MYYEVAPQLMYSVAYRGLGVLQTSSDLFFSTSWDDEDEVNSELAFFPETVSAVIEASKQKIPRNQVDQDHYGAHGRLVVAYFFEHPQYNEATFLTWFRMSRNLCTRIVQEITYHCPYFQLGADCTRKVSVSPLIKCTSAIRQMAYGFILEALDECMQMGETTARGSLIAFCTVVVELYGNDYLRKPTYTDIEKLYASKNMDFLG